MKLNVEITKTYLKFRAMFLQGYPTAPSLRLSLPPSPSLCQTPSARPDFRGSEPNPTTPVWRILFLPYSLFLLSSVEVVSLSEIHRRWRSNPVLEPALL